jgi:hypothetical protein
MLFLFQGAITLLFFKSSFLVKSFSGLVEQGKKATLPHIRILVSLY